MSIVADEVVVQQLQAFAGDELLGQLEEALTKFNIFAAIGATHRELWHSDFLAYLLDPMQNHGLHDDFLRCFLRETVPEVLGAASFERVVVQREYKYTDILIEDEEAKVSVIIENKIWSPEGAGQLKTYWEAISAKHPDPDWRIYGVYLTPTGRSPSGDSRYDPLSYGKVIAMLEEVLHTKSGQLVEGLELVIRHYIDILRRSIVGNTGANALARRLYFRHRSAMRLMNASTWKKMIAEHLLGLSSSYALLRREGSSIEIIHFRVVAWDRAAGLKSGTGRDKSYPLIYFGFQNLDDSLTLYLWLAPDIPQTVHKQIRQLAQGMMPPFCEPKKKDWYYCYNRPFLTEKDYRHCSDEELRVVIDEQWRQFVELDLPAILKAFEQEAWFWQVAEPPVLS